MLCVIGLVLWEPAFGSLRGLLLFWRVVVVVVVLPAVVVRCGLFVMLCAVFVAPIDGYKHVFVVFVCAH